MPEMVFSLFAHHHPLVRVFLRGYTEPRMARGEYQIFVVPLVVVTLKKPVTVMCDDDHVRVRAFVYAPVPKLGDDPSVEGFVMVDPMTVMTVKRNAWLDDGEDRGSYQFEYDGDTIAISSDNVLAAVPTGRFAVALFNEAKGRMMVYDAKSSGDMVDDRTMNWMLEEYETSLRRRSTAD